MRITGANSKIILVGPAQFWVNQCAMNTFRLVGLSLLLQIGLFGSATAAPPPLVADAPIVVPDSKGGFDYLQVDAAKRRLLANHTGNNTLDVFDLDTGKLLKHIPTGKAQGVAVDGDAEKYFVSVSKEKVLVIIDAKTLAKTGEVKLNGEADSIMFDPKNHCAYVDHDHAPEVWVVDTHAEKIAATVQLPGEPEYVLYDPASDRVYQNLVSTDSVAVIDPSSNTVIHSWSAAPAKKPHGLALDAATQRLFCAGANGKLVVMDSTNGKIIATVDIAESVDQIAFDAEKKRVYCASRKGVVSIVQETAEGAVSLGDVATGSGAKTIAVDPATHAVWVAYADQEHSYVLRLKSL